MIELSLMDANAPPPVKDFLITTVVLNVLGWGGLVTLFYFTLPTALPRWFFFFLVVLGITGAMLPVTAFLNLRFPSTPPPRHSVIVRQAIWFGLFGATMLWLQMGRVLTPTLAILLALGLALVEFLLRLSERSQWKP